MLAQQWLPAGAPSRDVAWVFPGQGTQAPGMGKALYESSDAARAIFDAADKALDIPLSRLCFEGPADELTQTINAQPAIMTVSLAALAAALEAGALSAPPVAMAGHSLGEYSALVAAGAMSLDDGLRLVRERGRLMQDAGRQNPGTLAAVVGLELAVLEQVCAETGAEVCNCNSAEQTVIGGTAEAVERAGALATERGAKRVAPLSVSAAFHSSLMKPAAQALAPAIASTTITSTRVPIIANATAEPISEPDAIRSELERQVDSRVLWQTTVERLAAGGVTTFIEIGPGKVLTGLIRRIVPGVQVQNIGDSPVAEPAT